MSAYTTTTVAVSVHLKGDNPIFGESATTIRLDDEAGGFFVVISRDSQEMRLDLEELESLCSAARDLVSDANKGSAE